ncbi:hypothetical protein FBU30_001623 [Linnemannia zychae]|nr:hypothetical protein FBU30_001623 [Linnemannia zychae]
MDSPNRFPLDDYTPIPEERRKILAEKFRRRNLAPESLIIRPGLRRLHVATILLTIGTAGYFALYGDFGDKETCFSPLRRLYHRKISDFWSLSDEEKKQLKEQGRL